MLAVVRSDEAKDQRKQVPLFGQQSRARIWIKGNKISTYNYPRSADFEVRNRSL